MFRHNIAARPDWKEKASEYGFNFHSMYGQPYWDEGAYYQFSLRQIEHDLEMPTEDLHQMCLHVVDQVVHSERWMDAFAIPECHRDLIRRSWERGEPSLYSRMDFAYDGRNPAKLFENNADTPTSLYETGFWQWLWLEDNVDKGALRRDCDQFNSLQEKLIARLGQIVPSDQMLHLACCADSEEDWGTITYLADCAREAGLSTHRLLMDDIGVDASRRFTDDQCRVIDNLFKLYPWEFMLREEFSGALAHNSTRWLEPAWKAVLSNKALLVALWDMFPGHPNLLPAYFTEDEARQHLNDYVRKPLFSREGANVTVVKSGVPVHSVGGPYGSEGYVYQAYHPVPTFGDQHVLIGSWLVGDRAAGISVREDTGPITQDLSRYLPHVILE